MKNKEDFTILFITVVVTIIISTWVTVCFMENTPEYRIGSEIRQEMIRNMYLNVFEIKK